MCVDLFEPLSKDALLPPASEGPGLDGLPPPDQVWMVGGTPGTPPDQVWMEYPPDQVWMVGGTPPPTRSGLDRAA